MAEGPTVKGLKLYRELDPDLLTEMAKAWLMRHEGSYTLVDNDRPRAVEWTDEIMGATIGYKVMYAGDEVGSFDDLGEAINAQQNARVDVKVTASVPRAPLQHQKAEVSK